VYENKFVAGVYGCCHQKGLVWFEVKEGKEEEK